ncbi:MAG: ABC transporter permease, partial [Acidimicrobiia bacterium]|nr:ABC transporter permease [Acidimicrobiia bacterium]
MKLVIEAIRSASAQPVSSIVTALIVGGVCAAILSTTGQTVQAERSVLGQIDAAGTRSVIIADTQGNAGITADAVDRIGRLSGVEWVVGLGPAFDVRPVANPGSRPVAVRTVHGELPPMSGMGLPGIGRAVAGIEAQRALGFVTPFGGVTGEGADLAMVGVFAAAYPLEFLDRGLLTRPHPGDHTVRTIHILATESRLVSQVSAAALAVLAADDPSSVALETS